jgi:spoIIIJ-associated protein
MKSIEMVGRTVEEAVQNALKVLNVTADKVEIEIIDEGSKVYLRFLRKRSKG